jgi:putative nucleotidyltransferase with HDIG domain
VALSAADLTAVHTVVLDALRVSSHQAVYPSQIAALELAPPFPSSLPSGQVRSVAGALYSAFLHPNRFPDSTLTAEAQQQAMLLVPAVQTPYQRGQVIVRSGDVVDATTLAVLRAAGLTGSNASWQLLFADLMICLVVAGLLHGYLISIRSSILIHPRQLLLLDVLMVSTLLAAAFVLQGGRVQPYLFPAAALSMLATVLLNGELAIVAMAVWAVLAGWYLGGSFELATYYLVTGLVGALLVRSVRRSSEFFLAGLTAAGTGLATILAFRLLNQGYDWLGFSTYAAGAAVSCGLAAALTLGSLSALGRLFGVTTALHLLELSHPNHPLLRRLMQEAPGTYHHSMLIGNLAERAAEQIGADPLLVRVAAYFHDIGKLTSPQSFAENQAGISNVHDQLDPQQSAHLIQQHVFGGVQLARHYHLPEVLEDAIWQHHGTNLVSYFYHQAVAQYGEDKVNADEYRYPGPRPQSREMAILMLADGVEAAVRASPGVDGDQIRAIIHRLTQERVRDGQLDECNLTLRDLAIIEESFATVLQGLSHPRVQYPAPLPAAAGND